MSLRNHRAVGAVVAAASSARLGWLLVLLGAVLRIAQYASGRSLWLDETYVAFNVLTKSYRGLLGTLDWGQGAPPGFTLGTKLLVAAFGSSVYVFWLLPLLAGLISLLLFRRLAQLTLPAVAANGALALFAVNAGLIRYSSELKPYEFDVAATLGVLVVGLLAWRRGFGPRDALTLAVVGLLAVFFSYPAVLVLVAVLIGAALAIALARRRDAVRGFALVAGIWAAAFAVVYAVFVPNLEKLQEHDLDVFYLPLPPTSGAELHRLGSALGGELAGDVALGLPTAIAVIAGALIVLSPLYLARRSLFAALELVLIVIVTVIAAGADQYPWGGRFTLFLVPVLIVCVFGGACALVSVRSGATAASLLVIAVLAVPVAEAAYHLFVPRNIEESKPLIDRLARQWRTGDTLYLNASAQFAFRYYTQYRGDGSPLWTIRPAPGGPAATAPALRSVPPWLFVAPSAVTSQALAHRAERLAAQHRRVWVLVTHLDDANLRPFERPPSSVRLVESNRATGAALYLLAGR